MPHPAGGGQRGCAAARAWCVFRRGRARRAGCASSSGAGRSLLEISLRISSGGPSSPGRGGDLGRGTRTRVALWPSSYTTSAFHPCARPGAKTSGGGRRGLHGRRPTASGSPQLISPTRRPRAAPLVRVALRGDAPGNLLRSRKRIEHPWLARSPAPSFLPTLTSSHSAWCVAARCAALLALATRHHCIIISLFSLSSRKPRACTHLGHESPQRARPVKSVHAAHRRGTKERRRASSAPPSSAAAAGSDRHPARPRSPPLALSAARRVHPCQRARFTTPHLPAPLGSPRRAAACSPAHVEQAPPSTPSASLSP